MGKSDHFIFSIDAEPWRGNLSTKISIVMTSVEMRRRNSYCTVIQKIFNLTTPELTRSLHSRMINKQSMEINNEEITD